MFSRLLTSMIAGGFTLLAVGTPARSALATLSQDTAAGTETFSIDFGHTPDLSDVDVSNRPADAFIIEIAAADSNPALNPTTVIRSSEVRFVDAIVLRDATPADTTDPHAGGWGATRGSVPFTIDGNDVSFTAPLELMGVPDGKFKYTVSTSHYGLETGFVQGEFVPVPLPPSILGGLGMLVSGIGVSVIRQLIQSRD